jgi:DNA-binding Lrp family transcriptional regulator
MSIEAFIFVECTSGRTKDVLSEVRKIAGVKSAHAITGNYDIIVLGEAQNLNELGEMIVTKIQAVSGVLRTSTSMVVDF